MIQDFENICGQKAFTPYLLGRCLTMDETQFTLVVIQAVQALAHASMWIPTLVLNLPYLCFYPCSPHESVVALSFGSSVFIFFSLFSAQVIFTHSPDQSPLAIPGEFSINLLLWDEREAHWIWWIMLGPQYPDFWEQKPHFQGHIISRNSSIKVAIPVVLLLNQVSLPDVQQARHWDANVCTREKIYLWDSQVSRPENKSQIHLPEDRV